MKLILVLALAAATSFVGGIVGYKQIGAALGTTVIENCCGGFPPGGQVANRECVLRVFPFGVGAAIAACAGSQLGRCMARKLRVTIHALDPLIAAANARRRHWGPRGQALGFSVNSWLTAPSLTLTQGGDRSTEKLKT
jgi:hypothetical protein